MNVIYVIHLVFLQSFIALTTATCWCDYHKYGETGCPPDSNSECITTNYKDLTRKCECKADTIRSKHSRCGCQKVSEVEYNGDSTFNKPCNSTEDCDHFNAECVPLNNGAKSSVKATNSSHPKKHMRKDNFQPGYCKCPPGKKYSPKKGICRTSWCPSDNYCRGIDPNTHCDTVMGQCRCNPGFVSFKNDSGIIVPPPFVVCHSLNASLNEHEKLGKIIKEQQDKIDFYHKRLQNYTHCILDLDRHWYWDAQKKECIDRRVGRSRPSVWAISSYLLLGLFLVILAHSIRHRLKLGLERGSSMNTFENDVHLRLAGVNNGRGGGEERRHSRIRPSALSAANSRSLGYERGNSEHTTFGYRSPTGNVELLNYDEIISAGTAATIGPVPPSYEEAMRMKEEERTG